MEINLSAAILDKKIVAMFRLRNFSLLLMISLEIASVSFGAKLFFRKLFILIKLPFGNGITVSKPTSARFSLTRLPVVNGVTVPKPG